MSAFTDAQRLWLESLAGMQADGERPKNVRVVVDDVGPEPDRVKLPNREEQGTNNLVEITHRDTGFVEKMLWTEVRASAFYVDNGIASLRAKVTNWIELEVPKIEILYSGGRKLNIPRKTIDVNSRGRADSYEKQKGFIVPLGGDGTPAFDSNNTPNVAVCEKWVRAELLRRSEDRLKIAELVATFAQAIAGLASAHPEAHGVKLGQGPASEQIGSRRRVAVDDGGRGPARRGGSANKPTVGESDERPPVSMRLDEEPKAPKGGGGRARPANAHDGDPRGTAGKTTGSGKSDKTTVDDRSPAEPMSGRKDSKGSKGNAGKSGTDKPTGAAEAVESGKDPSAAGSGRNATTGSAGKAPTAARPPLISDDELNQPVLQAKRAKGHEQPRRLEPVERRTAKEVLNALEAVRAGDKKAMERLAPFRPHLNTEGEFAGWYGIDLRPGNPGGLNQMRLYLKLGGTGDFKVILRQGH